LPLDIGTGHTADLNFESDPSIAAAVGQSFEAIRDGRAAVITDTVERVTGHKPKAFEAWAREHTSRFM